MKHSVCDDSNIQKSAEALAHSVFSCCYFPYNFLVFTHSLFNANKMLTCNSLH